MKYMRKIYLIIFKFLINKSNFKIDLYLFRNQTITANGRIEWNS